MWTKRHGLDDDVFNDIERFASEGLYGWKRIENDKFGARSSKVIHYKRSGSLEGIYAPIILNVRMSKEAKMGFLEIVDPFGDEVYSPSKEFHRPPSDSWIGSLKESAISEKNNLVGSDSPFLLLTTDLNPKGAKIVAEKIAHGITYQGEYIMGICPLKKPYLRGRFGPRSASLKSVSEYLGIDIKIPDSHLNVDLRAESLEATTSGLKSVIYNSLRAHFAQVVVSPDLVELSLYSKDKNITPEDIYERLCRSYGVGLDKERILSVIDTNKADYSSEDYRIADGLEVHIHPEYHDIVFGEKKSLVAPEVEEGPETKQERVPLLSPEEVESLTGDEDEESGSRSLTDIGNQLKRISRELIRTQKKYQEELSNGSSNSKLAEENERLQQEVNMLSLENSEYRSSIQGFADLEKGLQVKVTEMQSKFDRYKVAVAKEHEEDLESLVQSHDREIQKYEELIDKARRKEMNARNLVASFDEDDLIEKLEEAEKKAADSEELFDVADEENTLLRGSIASLNRTLEWYRKQNEELSVRERLEYSDNNSALEMPDNLSSICDVILFARGEFKNIHIRDGVEKECAELDGYEKSKVWMKKIFTYLASVNEYSAANKENPVSIQEFLSSSQSSYALPTYAVAIESAKSSSSPSYPNTRTFKLPNGSTEVFLSHIRIDRTKPGPRIHFFDDSRGDTGLIHIGYVGPHLPTTSEA